MLLATLLFLGASAMAVYLVGWTLAGPWLVRSRPGAVRRLQQIHSVVRERRIHRKAGAVAGMLVTALHIRVCVVERVQVRGPSMVPTLAEGRTLWTEKLSTGLIVPRLDFPLNDTFHAAFPTGKIPRFGLAGLERGDVVVFQYPGLSQKNRRFIKRVVGLPGDRFEIRDGRVWIDGAPLAEPYLPAGMGTEPRPRLEQPPVQNAPSELDLLSPEVKHSAMNGCDQKGVVPPHTVYVLGDNRPYSRDSRTIGFIPIFYIDGVALLSDSPG